MARYKNNDAREYENLKKIGFELRAPQDEFSFQPDSGSSIGGILGKQEYGIDTDFDAEGQLDQRAGLAASSDNPITQQPWEREIYGDSDIFSAEKIRLTDAQLQALVENRLTTHARLDASQLQVEVKNSGVIVTGSVLSDAAKLRINEIIEALPGVENIDNKVQVTL